MSQLSRCKLTRVRKTVEETVWRDVLTTICRSEDLTVPPLVDLTVPPLVGCCRWNLAIICRFITYRKLHRIISESFTKNLKEKLNYCDDISVYNSTVISVLDKHVPQTSRSVTNRHHQPWYNKEITLDKRELRKNVTILSFIAN